MFALTAAFLLLSFRLFAQDSNKVITIDAKDVTVKELLAQIEQKSDYTFVYKDADLDTSQRVTLQATGTIEQLVKQAFPNLSMHIENRMIILNRIVSKAETAGGG